MTVTLSMARIANPAKGRPAFLSRVLDGEKLLASRYFSDSVHGGPVGSQAAAEQWLQAKAAEHGRTFKPKGGSQSVAAGMFAGVAGYLLGRALVGLRVEGAELERLLGAYRMACDLIGVEVEL